MLDRMTGGVDCRVGSPSALCADTVASGQWVYEGAPVIGQVNGSHCEYETVVRRHTNDLS